MSSPPHSLQLVIDFVNTLDVETGEDLTDTPAHLGEWLTEQGLRSGDEPELETSAPPGHRAARSRCEPCS